MTLPKNLVCIFFILVLFTEGISQENSNGRYFSLGFGSFEMDYRQTSIEPKYSWQTDESLLVQFQMLTFAGGVEFKESATQLGFTVSFTSNEPFSRLEQNFRFLTFMPELKQRIILPAYVSLGLGVTRELPLWNKNVHTMWSWGVGVKCFNSFMLGFQRMELVSFDIHGEQRGPEPILSGYAFRISFLHR